MNILTKIVNFPYLWPYSKPKLNRTLKDIWHGKIFSFKIMQ